MRCPPTGRRPGAGRSPRPKEPDTGVEAARDLGELAGEPLVPGDLAAPNAGEAYGDVAAERGDLWWRVPVRIHPEDDVADDFDSPEGREHANGFRGEHVAREEATAMPEHAQECEARAPIVLHEPVGVGRCGKEVAIVGPQLADQASRPKQGGALPGLDDAASEIEERLPAK
jgi:hypothetical protein